MKTLMRGRCLFALLFLALTTAASAQGDRITSVVVSPLTSGGQAFPGTDGKMHMVYELVLTNASPTAATLQKIEVVDATNPSRVLGSWEGSSLVANLRTTGSSPVTSPEIEFNSTRLFLIALAVDRRAQVPARLEHRITLLGADTPARTPVTPVAQTYTVAPFNVGMKVPVIDPPLAGKGWVAVNGCCATGGAHRSTSVPVNGGIHFAQRFAIDWMKLDEAGRFVNGDAANVRSFVGYGADVLAVAEGKVVSTLDQLNDQKPGSLPDPKTINIENVDGNHIVLDLGDGVFAFYAHLQKGSIRVSVGDHVKPGQVMAKLGNTGNTSAPHLHFHLMDGPSVLGSSGIPYVIRAFDYDGQVSAEKFASVPGIEGAWGEGRLATPEPRHDQFPMDLAIINFGTD